MAKLFTYILYSISVHFFVISLVKKVKYLLPKNLRDMISSIKFYLSLFNRSKSWDAGMSYIIYLLEKVYIVYIQIVGKYYQKMKPELLQTCI